MVGRLEGTHQHVSLRPREVFGDVVARRLASGTSPAMPFASPSPAPLAKKDEKDRQSVTVEAHQINSPPRAASHRQPGGPAAHALRGIS
jgi:hypothetical protein